MKNIAVIFDMDGVVVDNTKFHVAAWKKFAKKLGTRVTYEIVRNKFLGRLGREIVREVLKVKISDNQLEKFGREREAYFRKIFAQHIKPVKGLPEFLGDLKNNKIKVALATSAPPENVKFILAKTRLKKYFPVTIDATGVKRGKPNPDIFLKAAKKLNARPKDCVVFEDAFHGIEAAQRAGMKVVAVATTHHPKSIAHADLVIKDFDQINIYKLLQFI